MYSLRSGRSMHLGRCLAAFLIALSVVATSCGHLFPRKPEDDSAHRGSQNDAVVDTETKTNLDSGHQPSLTLTISRDFGQTILSEWNGTEEVEEGQTALELLKDKREVEAAYGGAFVVGIDGLRSNAGPDGGEGEHGDWLFYHNGVLSPIGAGEVVLRQGDRSTWDFHPWEGDYAPHALVGDFPQPFASAGGAVIASSPILFESAKQLAQMWQELYGWTVDLVELVPSLSLWDHPRPLFLLADPDAVAAHGGLQRLLTIDRERAGLPVMMEPDTTAAYESLQTVELAATVAPSPQGSLWLALGPSYGKAETDPLWEHLFDELASGSVPTAAFAVHVCRTDDGWVQSTLITSGSKQEITCTAAEARRP